MNPKPFVISMRRLDTVGLRLLKNDDSSPASVTSIDRRSSAPEPEHDPRYVLPEEIRRVAAASLEADIRPSDRPASVRPGRFRVALLVTALVALELLVGVVIRANRHGHPADMDNAGAVIAP
jgi:GAF domain-containing protein